jgi:hypothetical protein
MQRELDAVVSVAVRDDLPGGFAEPGADARGDHPAEGLRTDEGVNPEVQFAGFAGGLDGPDGMQIAGASARR